MAYPRGLDRDKLKTIQLQTNRLEAAGVIWKMVRFDPKARGFVFGRRDNHRACEFIQAHKALLAQFGGELPKHILRRGRPFNNAITLNLMYWKRLLRALEYVMCDRDAFRFALPNDRARRAAEVAAARIRVALYPSWARRLSDVLVRRGKV